MTIDIVRQRLRNQRLASPEFQKPGDVVAWLGAVQAQDFAGAKWAVGLRARGITDGDVEREFDTGSILRTHLLRPTWHNDEYLIAYKDRGSVLESHPAASRGAVEYPHHLVVDGKVRGSWKRTLGMKAAALEVRPFRPLPESDASALAAEAARYGRFLNLPVTLVARPMNESP